MPGYESERFTNLSPTEKADMICGICQDVFRCPVVTNCCLQTFCEDCITDWLQSNKSCPYDRADLTESQLSRPPRVMMNMLGKLKIKCEFHNKGCKEVVLLENLNTHVLSCKYNAENSIMGNKKCKKCFTEKAKSGHDCVKHLLEVNKNLSENLAKFKKDYETVLQKIKNNRNPRIIEAPNSHLMRELNELKIEKENFLKTIQELCNTEETTNTEWLAIQASNKYLLRELDELKKEKENLLKTIQELSKQIATNSGPSMRELYNYNGEDSDELTIKYGDMFKN